MAVYKQPCLHCGEFIGRDSRFCPKCCSRSPFGYHCPTCLREIKKDEKVCSSCGRQLNVFCPVCKETTFVDERCEKCSAELMIPCTNSRCGERQFFENINCTACGKKIKKKEGK